MPMTPASGSIRAGSRPVTATGIHSVTQNIAIRSSTYKHHQRCKNNDNLWVDLGVHLRVLRNTRRMFYCENVLLVHLKIFILLHILIYLRSPGEWAASKEEELASSRPRETSSRARTRAPHTWWSSVPEVTPVKTHRSRHLRARSLARWPILVARGVSRMYSRSAGDWLCGARWSAQQRTLSDVWWNSYLAFRASLWTWLLR